MPLISVIEECYNELNAIRNKMREAKIKRGEPSKTTYGEVVFMLIREYKNTLRVAKQ